MIEHSRQMQKDSMIAVLSSAEKHALIGDSTVLLLLLLLLAPLPSQGPAYQDQEFWGSSCLCYRGPGQERQRTQQRDMHSSLAPLLGPLPLVNRTSVA